MPLRVLLFALVSLLSAPAGQQTNRIAIVSFPSRDAGFGFTDAGRELFSSDAGKSWQLVRIGISLSSADFVSLRLGFGLTAQGVLLATRDSGHR